MKKLTYILAFTALLSACKKEKTPDPSPAQSSGGTTSADSSTYVITASSNHRRALYNATLYTHPNGAASAVFTYNFNQTGSVYQDLPITYTIKVHKNDSLYLSLTAKNNIPSELTDTNAVWSNLQVKKNNVLLISQTKTIPSTQSFVYNKYTINGHN